VVLIGNVTDVIRAGERWLAESLVSTELLLRGVGVCKGGGGLMAGVNGLQGCEYVSGRRKWH
jgi:hypothetical protein